MLRFLAITMFGLLLSSVFVEKLNAEQSSLRELESASGRDLMEKVYHIHQQFPYVYEEQSMVLLDRNGWKETRKLKRYSRVEGDGEAKFLLVFESPEDVKGVAVLASRHTNGQTSQSIYLPAFGPSLISNAGDASHSNFLGTDFSVENLIGEELEDYTLQRQRDAILEGVEYFVVDVFQGNSEQAQRRHFILKDILFIARTDFYDNTGKLQKSQTQHDLNQVLGKMWRANMLLMQDFREDHQTLIKINKRVFSADYVPKEVFTVDWLFENALQPDEYELRDEELSTL
ncbi:MAG: hypothetical protein ACI9FB_000909 [Candidatus Azotimanducaceae bacterium]|jgi:hypothetical protein